MPALISNANQRTASFHPNLPRSRLIWVVAGREQNGLLLGRQSVAYGCQLPGQLR